MATGIRELKNRLSEFVRRAEAGERVAVTAHGKVVAVLGPADTDRVAASRRRPFSELVASGVIEPPLAPDAPIQWPAHRLPSGTAASLIDEDRGDA